MASNCRDVLLDALASAGTGLPLSVERTEAEGAPPSKSPYSTMTTAMSRAERRRHAAARPVRHIVAGWTRTVSSMRSIPIGRLSPGGRTPLSFMQD